MCALVLDVMAVDIFLDILRYMYCHNIIQAYAVCLLLLCLSVVASHPTNNKEIFSVKIREKLPKSPRRRTEERGVMGKNEKLRGILFAQ